TLTITPPSPAAPSNNACASATNVGEGDTPATNCGATQDGVTTGCRTGFNDAWFRYIYGGSCNTPVTVGICDANFDTDLFAYSGTACPVTVGREVACNDDACGLQSRISFSATTGQQFLIRLASFSNGSTGSGTLVIACSACPCDWNHSGSLNSQDFF